MFQVLRNWLWDPAKLTLCTQIHRHIASREIVPMGLNTLAEQLDPLVLSEQLDILPTAQVVSGEERELAPTGFLSHDLHPVHQPEDRREGIPGPQNGFGKITRFEAATFAAEQGSDVGKWIVENPGFL